MPSVIYVPSRIGEGHFVDFQPPASGVTDNGKIWAWNSATSKFEPVTVSAASPGGSNTHVQFNNGGAFAGDSGFTYAGSGVAILTGRLVVPVIRPASDSTTAVKIQNSAGTSDVVSINTTNGTTTLRRTTAGANTLRILDTDGTELYKESPDTSNYHMYYRRNPYINVVSPATSMTINTSLFVTGALYLSGDLPLGALTYATAINTLSSSGKLRLVSFAWNGSNGYTLTSAFDINAQQQSAANNDSAIVVHSSGYGNIIGIKSNGDVGVGTIFPNNKLDVVGTVQMDGLRIDVAPTAETITCTHTVTFSANGTNYKFPCVLA